MPSRRWQRLRGATPLLIDRWGDLAEIDNDRPGDLIFAPRSTADRGMGLVFRQPAEIDTNRQGDLIFAPRSTADRSMGIAIDGGLHQGRRHV